MKFNRDNSLKYATLMCGIITMLFAISRNAYCQSTQNPSPQVLMQSWQQLDEDIKNSLHSYHMDGTATTISDDGKPTPSQVLPNQWHAINDGDNFNWGFDDALGKHLFATYSNEYDSYTEQPGEPGINSHNQKKQQPIGDYLHYYYESRVPFRIEDFVNYPTIVLSPDAMQTKVPFAEYYNTLLPNLQTVGTDLIGNWHCFHVQMSPDRQPTGMILPTDIWFAVVGSRFVPVQFYLVDKERQMRAVVTVTKLQPLDTEWLPVEYRVSQDLKETMPSGEETWAHVLPRYRVVSLNLSEINTAFPEADFRLTLPQGTQLFQNEKSAGIKKDGKSNLTHPTGIIRLAIIILFALVCVSLLWRRYRTRHS